MIKFTLPFLLIIFIFVITISINAPSIEAQEDVDGFAPIVTYEGPLVFSVNLPAAAADHMSPRSFVNSGSGEVNLGNVYSNIEKSDDSDVDRYDFTSFGKYQHSGSWTNVVPFVINEKPYVLFYDLLSGNYVIDCISASGAVSIQEDVFNSGIPTLLFLN